MSSAPCPESFWCFQLLRPLLSLDFTARRINFIALWLFLFVSSLKLSGVLLLEPLSARKWNSNEVERRSKNKLLCNIQFYEVIQASWWLRVILRSRRMVMKWKFEEDLIFSDSLTMLKFTDISVPVLMWRYLNRGTHKAHSIEWRNREREFEPIFQHFSLSFMPFSRALKFSLSTFFLYRSWRDLS